jgi:formylglycine-generating enzyme required for sulfatase activity
MSLANADSSSGRHQQQADMRLVPGGTFRMGSDRHYPEEAPVHHVTVDGFWMDRTPVTNRRFREFVEATGYVTFAEIAPDPKDYPGALPHMLKAGSLVFDPPDHPVDLGNFANWVEFQVRRQLASSPWQGQFDPRSRRPSRCAHFVPGCRSLCRLGRQTTADRSRMGVCGTRRS